jgi:hypothetical protein
MSENPAEFGELVSLLARVAPDRLDKLRANFPAATVQLRPGAVMGESSWNVGCAVALEALKVYGPAAAKICVRLRRRLAWSWRFDLLAKFAAACGSGGAVGVLAAGIAIDKAIMAAFVALVGSLCGLFFSYLQRDETAGSVTESYNKLIVALVQSDELQRSLQVLCGMGDTHELHDALVKANETAKTLNEMVLRFA